MESRTEPGDSVKPMMGYEGMGTEFLPPIIFQFHVSLSLGLHALLVCSLRTFQCLNTLYEKTQVRCGDVSL